jgi:hypothetical protein
MNYFMLTPSGERVSALFFFSLSENFGLQKYIFLNDCQIFKINFFRFLNLLNIT